MNRQNIVLHYWKSLLMISIILYLSCTPPSTFKAFPVFTHIDKIAHLLMYFCLSLLLIFDFKSAPHSKTNKQIFIIICIVLPIFLGGSIEFIQKEFFPPRSASFGDIAFNTLGVMLGWLTSSKAKITIS